MTDLNLLYLETLARKAGEIVRAGYAPSPGKNPRNQISYKGVIDLVTEIDHRSEALLKSEIQRDFPEHRILAEESGATQGLDCCIWLVDPIDGTVNYAHGIPFFAVSIAFMEDRAVKYGVVYDPLRDECFSAEKGGGAFLNGEPVSVSAAEELDRSLLATGFPYNIRTTEANNLNHYARFALRSQGVRRLGVASLDLCYVAVGRLDGYWELLLEPWDIAAGVLIAQEAGAVVTKVDGSPDLFKRPISMIAANPRIHPQILAVLKDS